MYCGSDCCEKLTTLNPIINRAIPRHFSESGQATISNFPEILLKLSLPHMMKICKIWMKSVKKWQSFIVGGVFMAKKFDKVCAKTTYFV